MAAKSAFLVCQHLKCGYVANNATNLANHMGQLNTHAFCTHRFSSMSCSGCDMVYKCGIWREKCDDINGRDRFKCTHEGCSYYSKSVRPANEAQAVARHEQSFFMHVASCAGKSCARCFELSQTNKQWQRQEERWNNGSMSSSLQSRLKTKATYHAKGPHAPSGCSEIHYQNIETELTGLAYKWQYAEKKDKQKEKRVKERRREQRQNRKRKRKNDTHPLDRVKKVKWADKVESTRKRVSLPLSVIPVAVPVETVAVPSLECTETMRDFEDCKQSTGVVSGILSAFDIASVATCPKCMRGSHNGEVTLECFETLDDDASELRVKGRKTTRRPRIWLWCPSHSACEWPMMPQHFAYKTASDNGVQISLDCAWTRSTTDKQESPKRKQYVSPSSAPRMQHKPVRESIQKNLFTVMDTKDEPHKHSTVNTKYFIKMMSLCGMTTEQRKAEDALIGAENSILQYIARM